MMMTDVPATLLLKCYIAATLHFKCYVAGHSRNDPVLVGTLEQRIGKCLK